MTKAVPDVWEVFTDNFYYLPISDDMEKIIMEKIMFEVFNVPVMCVAIQALLARCRHGFWCRYALMKYRMFETDFAEGEMEDWHRVVLYFSTMLSFMTSGLALMEVDHRTSAAVKRVLNESFFAQFRHMLFRSCEVGFRPLTVAIFAVYIRLFKRTY